jgi:hypothetical protein
MARSLLEPSGGMGGRPKLVFIIEPGRRISNGAGGAGRPRCRVRQADITCEILQAVAIDLGDESKIESR